MSETLTTPLSSLPLSLHIQRLEHMIYPILHSCISDIHRNNTNYYDDIIKECQCIQQRIKHSSIFSKNETLDDINTSSFPYLLIYYYQAECYINYPIHISQRLKYVKLAMVSSSSNLYDEHIYV